MSCQIGTAPCRFCYPITPKSTHKNCDCAYTTPASHVPKTCYSHGSPIGHHTIRSSCCHGSPTYKWPQEGLPRSRSGITDLQRNLQGHQSAAHRFVAAALQECEASGQNGLQKLCTCAIVITLLVKFFTVHGFHKSLVLDVLRFVKINF
ncbi:uncharacterized protein CEXT_516651 [Caerostris extrusa]|uniref:Uncharacterized protein n=1 Tax=Caerostris extrusa TaxID=172846 RepID=A0AAV4PIC7_CAEEX|nr:uncharacterized protein CEXT_516651 [Caerostris extrusa]